MTELLNNAMEEQTPEEKKKQLFLNQKQLLDTFLEHGAISKAQYDKSLGDLIVKMGMDMEPDSQNLNQGSGHPRFFFHDATIGAPLL